MSAGDGLGEELVTSEGWCGDVDAARDVALGEGRRGCAQCGYGSHVASTDLMGRIRQPDHHNRCCDPFHPKTPPSPRLSRRFGGTFSRPLDPAGGLWPSSSPRRRVLDAPTHSVAATGQRRGGTSRWPTHSTAATGQRRGGVSSPEIAADLPRNPHPGAALTQKPRLTCMDEIQRSHVSAECKDDGVNKVSSTYHRKLFESFLGFLLSMST